MQHTLTNYHNEHIHSTELTHLIVYVLVDDNGDDQNGQKGQGIVPAGQGEAHDGEAHDGEAEDANLRNCELESISTMPLTELCMCCKMKVKLLV